MSWILSIILALSLFLRVGLLNKVPPELFGDEIDVGYQAYSLLKTGRDIYNQPLPTYIHSLSEWRPPLLMYASVPTISIFGLNVWGVRLPEVIFGSIGPLILLLLVTQVSKSRKFAILASLSLAIMPWHIHYSRAAFEVVLMLDLIMLGTLLFLKKRFELCALSFALSMYTYGTAILFVPLWLTALHFFPRTRVRLFPLLLLLLILAPLIYNILSGPASGRFSLLTINKNNNNKEQVDRIFTLRQESGPFWGRILHNHIESSANTLITNYLRTFSSEFLFVRGDPVYRHNLQIIGELLPLSAPLLILGLYMLAIHRQWFWLIWLVLAPIPSALTSDGGYHATRLFLMIPPLAVAIGLGWLKLPKTLRILAAILMAVQLAVVGYYYVVHYSRSSWRWWHVGYQSTMTQLGRLAPNYNKVFINNTYEPSLIRFLFWTAYPPQEFHRNFTLDQSQANIVPNYSGFTLDNKYFFGNFIPQSWADSLLPNSLYLISQRDNDLPSNVQVLFTSTNSYNEPILYLVAKK